MSNPTGTRRTAPKKDAAQEKVTTEENTTVLPAGLEWAEDFDSEEYPDAVMLGDGQKMFFNVITSNIIPLMNKRTNVLEDTEVVQVEVLAGSTVTEKILGEEKEYVDTGELVPAGEIRSLWINSQLLRNIWSEWDVQDGDQGALSYKGKVQNHAKTNEYQKWIGRFKKTNPRGKISRQSVAS